MAAALRLTSFMKFLIRTFFKSLRVVLGPVMLLKERLTRPTALQRLQAAQNTVNQQCGSLVLFHYKTCPFCMKVRQEMRRLSLPIQHLDAQAEGLNRDALRQGGGLVKVPCLKITDAAGGSQWLYDSDKIVAYLRSRFANTSADV
jgi:glutaredoxin